MSLLYFIQVFVDDSSSVAFWLVSLISSTGFALAMDKVNRTVLYLLLTILGHSNFRFSIIIISITTTTRQSNINNNTLCKCLNVWGGIASVGILAYRIWFYVITLSDRCQRSQPTERSFSPDNCGVILHNSQKLKIKFWQICLNF